MSGNDVTDLRYLLHLYTKCADVKASGKKPDTFNCSKSIMFINRTVTFYFKNRPYSRCGHDEQKARLGWQIYRKFARQYVT